MASHELVGSGCRDGEEELILNVFWKKSQPNSYFGCGPYFKKIIYFIFVYFWLRWVFAAGRGLSLVAASRSYSSLQCTGFSLQWLLLSWSTGSRRAGFSSCGSWSLERRLSSCGARA